MARIGASSLMDSEILHRDTFTSSVLGNTVRVDVRIAKTYRTSADFSVLGTAYTFTFDKWRCRQLTTFLHRFHAHAGRDEATYGRVKENDEGSLAVCMDLQHKINAIMQAVRDVVTCLDQIGQEHKRGMLDYAVWYREKHREEGSYSELITRATCHCIVHSDFLAPNVAWNLVQFH